MNRPPVQRRVVLALQSTAIGGMETHVVDLAGEYVRRGIKTHIIVPEDEALDPVAERAAAAGAEVHRLDTDARQGRTGQVRRLATLIRLLRRVRPHAVHLHTGGATGGLALIAASRATTSATVAITEHDVPAEAPSSKQRAARRAMDRAAHLVVAVSRRNASIRQERLPVANDNFVSVLNGVPMPETSPGEQAENAARVRAEMGLPADIPVIGSLVRLAPGKGLDTLFGAFAILHEQTPCELLLVGDGPLRDELEALAIELGIRLHVHFAGNRAQPAPYLDAMDVFVLPVPAGSMSIALLEAMARGLPPVITFGGPEEAVIDGETGLTPPPNDPPALAEALRALVDDPVRRRELGAAAADHVRRHFSVARVADDLLEVYKLARRGAIPERLRADGPPNPRPGDR